MTEVWSQVSDDKAQVPWSRTSLTRAVYLNPVVAPAPNAVTPSSTAPALASTSGNSDVELEILALG
jgi:hypothetical protein